MNNREIGCLVVVQDGKPTGIVTERDKLKRVLVARTTLTQEVPPHNTERCFDKLPRTRVYAVVGRRVRCS